MGSFVTVVCRESVVPRNGFHWMPLPGDGPRNGLLEDDVPDMRGRNGFAFAADAIQVELLPVMPRVASGILLQVNHNPTSSVVPHPAGRINQ